MTSGTMLPTTNARGRDMSTFPIQLQDGGEAAEPVWPLVVLNWPEDAAENAALARQRRPRVLLIAPGAEPPVDPDGLSDWVQLPASVREIYARVEVLQRRVEMMQRRAQETPHLYMDADGLVRRGRQWVALSPIETRLMHALLSRPGAVKTPTELIAAGWPDERVRPDALHPRLNRLRTRLLEIGVRVVNVRQRGYALSIDDL